MTNTNEFLSQGIAALKAGQKTQARSLLEQVVQQDERNEMGWLWLSGAVDTDEERRLCLENVLAINPSNNVAQQGLKQLSIKQGVRSLPQSADVPSGTRQVNKAASSKVAQRDESLATSSIERPTRSTSKPHVKRRLPVLGLAFGTVAVCIFTGFMLLGVRAQDIANSFTSKKAQDIANSFSCTVP